MSAYPRSASQFLTSTFAPFGGAARHNEVDTAAPLFFSTIDGESAEGLDDGTGDDRSRYYYHDDDEEEGMAATGQAARSSSTSAVHAADQRHDAYHHQPHPAGGGPHNERAHEEMHVSTSRHGAESPYNHDGLGRSPSEVGSDESHDPFRPRSTRSRQSAATSSTPSRDPSKQASASSGWRMHRPSLLPGVTQSVLHNLYEQSESVYSSVFIGNKLDKGKQRATEDVYLDSGASARPGFPGQPPAYLTQGDRRTLPLRQNGPAMQHSQPDLPQGKARIHRYPMPTSRYRRAARGVKDAAPTAADMEWQDQSYRDPAWLAIYLSNLLFTTFLSLYLLFFDSTRIPSSTHLIAPSVAILRSIPLLSLLVLASLLITISTLAYTLFVKNGARQAAFIFVLSPPIVFLVGAGWAFEASFGLDFHSSDGQRLTGGWAQRTLRITSLCLLLCAGFAFRRSWQTLFSSGSSSRRARLERTIRVLQVSADVILQHPQLIFLAIVLVGGYVVSSVPVMLVVAQLLYHGMIKQGASPSAQDSYTYLIPGTWPIILSLHTVFVYFWTLGLLRAIYQHTIAGTVGSWWYEESDSDTLSKAALDTDFQNEFSTSARTCRQKTPLLQAQQNVLDAFHRATGPSLGTLCASSLILAILSLFTLLISLCYSLANRSRRWTGTNMAATCLRVTVHYVVLPFAAIISGIIQNLNAFALVYAAITGDRFWAASHEASDLIMGRNGTEMVASHLMLRSLLSIFSVALGFLGGLAGYVSSVYWFSVPPTFPDSQAKDVAMITPWLAAFICGIVPFWTVRFSSDLLSNAVDATFVCFNIDLDMGQIRNKEAYDAFAYEEGDAEPVESEEPIYGMSGLYRSESGESV